METLSQSKIKAFWQVVNCRLCGERFKRIYVTKEVENPSTVSMEYGKFFEQEAIGATAIEGEKIEPELLKTGANKGQPKAPWRNALAQAENWKADVEFHRVKILEVQKTVTRGDFRGTIDVLADMEGVGKCIIDLKYSGLLYKKWEDLGWHEDFLHEKNEIIFQAKHYSWLMEGMPFIFAVYSSTNDMDREWFKMDFGPGWQDKHAENLQLYKQQIAKQEADGLFPPRPDLKSCKDCPWLDHCDFGAAHPVVKLIEAS